MGRFSSLEINEPPEPETQSGPQAAGELIKDAQYFLDEGERAFYRMEYEDALRNYSRASGEDTGSIDAWQGQVFSLIELEEYHEAGIWLDKAQELLGETPDFLALQALIATRTGEFERACAYSDASLQAGGASPLPFLVRGELFSYAKKNSEQCFNQACALAESSWKIRILIADACLFSRKRVSRALALKYLLPALDQYPLKPELHLHLARVRIVLHDKKAASDALDRAEGLDSTMKRIREMRTEIEKCGFWHRFFHWRETR